MTTGVGKGVFNFDKIEDWANLRARAIDAFDGELPNAQTEQTIIDAYEQHPEAVKKTLAQVATDYAKGTIRTGWGVTKNRAERILAPPSNPSAKTGIDRERTIARAEAWVKTTGVHFDRTDELLEDLFGDRGPLHDYAQIERTETGRNTDGHPIYALTPAAGDTELTERMCHLWAEHRHKGLEIERDAEQRAEKWKQQQRLLAESLAQAKQILDQKQPVPATADDDLPF